MSRYFCRVLILCVLCIPTISKAVTTCYWLGGTGNWSTTSKWFPSAPVTGDIVIIGNYSSASQVTADVSISLTSITFYTTSTTIGLTVNSGVTLTTTAGITQQHSANNTSVTTTINGAGSIICKGSFVVGDTTTPPAPGSLGFAASGNTNITNLTTVNLSLPSVVISQNFIVNTTSKTGNVYTAVLGGTLVPAANVNNAFFNFGSGSIIIGLGIQMTNSAYASVGSFTGSGVNYAATKNQSQFIVNPTSNVTAGSTETLTIAGATPLSMNADGNGAATLDFNGGGSGTTKVIYSGSGTQSIPNSIGTTGLDQSPAIYQNITFSGAGTKTVQAGNMSISGNWSSNTGKVDLTTNSTTVTFSGTAPVITDTVGGSGSGLGVVFNNLTLSSSSPTLSTTGKFAIGSAGVLTLSGASMLATNGNLTLNSDATGSASVAAITGGGSVSGNVNVQRYVQGNNNINYRGYRLLSSPVNTSGLISLDYIANSTIVTGATTTAGGTVGGNPTIYLYNESLPVNNTSFVSGNFVGVTNTTSTTIGTLSGSTTGTTTLPKGNGYFVYFRGDNIHTTNKTTVPFANPENVTFTATGALNQGNVTVNDWYTANLSFTSSQAAIAKGFNLVGNPYASSINWDLVGSTITTTNVDNTIYIYNPSKKAYASYVAGTGGIAGGNWPTNTTNANIIPSGQGFFVHANNSGATITFTETAKIAAQQATSTNLMLSAAPPTLYTNPSYLRVQLSRDTLNEEDVLLLFNPNSSSKYVINEDAYYLKGNNAVSLSLASADNVPLAIDQLPLPQSNQTIGLNVKTASLGTHQLKLTQLNNIPDLYDIWLMDNYMRDSLDIKHNPTYTFVISADTNSSSLSRFKLVIRVNPLLAYRLLNFTGSKITGGDQLNWTVENENTNTVFTVQRSTDEGKFFSDMATMPSTAAGNYNYMDSSPAPADWYRLKQTDQLGNVTYSNVVGIQYSNLSNSAVADSRLSVYPNPTADVVNMAVNSSATTTNGNYNIIITNGAGNVVKNTTSTQSTWQGNVSGFSPGIYVVKVIDKNNNKVIGTGKFIKM